ncbi:hypothetical protein JCM8547_000541 [Rhodosporidiobolus lusitaniae]
MSVFPAYRPRQSTAKEIEEAKEAVLSKRERFLKRRKKEANQADERSAKLHYSALSGIGFQDYTLGPSKAIGSRGKLDHDAYLALRAARTAKPAESTFSPSPFPRLSAICLSLVVENYGEPGIFDRLDPVAHRQHIGPLLNSLAHELDDLDVLPFQVWLDLVARCPSDIPSRRRTYRGLCVSDTAELEVLREINTESVQLFAQEQALSSSCDLTPPFFLAYLDLSGEVGYKDADMYKLRDPLSHCLAVLNLAGTGITDDGLAWLARAASEPPRYAHLQVLSLQGLQGVTDKGVVKLAMLNLRCLDLRQTRCNDVIRKKLNNALVDLGSPTSFRAARVWDSLPDPAIELQLFDSSNFTTARVLTLLHYLAVFFNTPTHERRSALSSPLVKPIGVSISSMTRGAAPSSSSAILSNPATLSAGKAEMTAEELYHAHLSLQAGSTHATHHRAFGAVTSTMALSKKAVDEDGHAETDKGAAFLHRRDEVAAGRYIGTEGKSGGGRASLYDVGTRRFHKVGGGPPVDRHGLKMTREPFSDSEDEREKEAEEEEKLEAAQRQWDENAARQRQFYAGSRPAARPPRQFVAPALSPFMLVRHLPLKQPYEEIEVLKPLHRAVEVGEEEEVKVRAGGTLVKKRRRTDNSSTYSPSPTATTTPFAPRPAQPRPLPTSRPSFPTSPFPSSSSPPLSSRSPAPPAPSPAPPSSSNPFSKKRPALATPRHSAKNIVKTATALPKRSGLAAFRGKK